MKGFDEVLDLAEAMDWADREALVNVLKARLREERRARLVAEVAEANREFEGGSYKAATSAEIMREILR